MQLGFSSIRTPEMGLQWLDLTGSRALQDFFVPRLLVAHIREEKAMLFIFKAETEESDLVTRSTVNVELVTNFLSWIARQVPHNNIMSRFSMWASNPHREFFGSISGGVLRQYLELFSSIGDRTGSAGIFLRHDDVSVN